MKWTDGEEVAFQHAEEEEYMGLEWDFSAIAEDSQKMQSYIEAEVMQYLDLSKEIQDEEIYNRIDEVFQRLGRQHYISVESRLKLREAVYCSMRGLDVLTPLLQDEEITEIMVNGYDHIFIEKQGKIYPYEKGFRDVVKYHDVIQQIVADANRIVNESSPIVDARLKDGSRVNVVLSPISLDGSTMTIRKFPKEALTMERLIEMESLSEEVAEFMQLLVLSGYNIIISGGTGSGKTTFLNALSNYIPKEERIITIEDSAELQLRNVSNLVRLEVRNANVEGQNAISMKDLIKSSLRMRPDRIIVGEVRGEEALDMLQAMNTGHDGSISSAHANSAKDMLSRMETMVLMGVDMPIASLRRQIASAVDIVVHLGRLRDHSRRVLEIVEVLQVEQEEIVCNPLFVFREYKAGQKGETNRCNTASDGVQIQRMNPDKRDSTETAGVQGREDLEGGRHIRVQGQLCYSGRMRQLKKLEESGYYDKYCELMQRIKKLQLVE